MSWLVRSLANSLKFDDDDDDGDKNIGQRNRESPSQSNREEEEGEEHQIESSPETPGRGVKEDLSNLTQTLTRQLRGVASFLAPPPSEPSSPSPPQPNRISSTDPSISDWNRWESSDQSVSGDVSDPEIDDSAGISGIRSDFAEIGGKFRTGISKLSNHKAVSEISKIASNFLPFGSELDSVEMYSMGGAVGVTDEVLTFARNIAMHPETWLDFPLLDDEESDDFDMSDAQQEHALAVECLAPRLAALRIELCPGHMSEGCFWKIYFVLLHSRLNKHDAELLSTPQIVEARALMMQELQKKSKPESDKSGRGTSYSKEAAKSLQEERLSALSNAHSETVPPKTFAFEATTSTAATDFKTEKHPVVSTEMPIIDKPVVEEAPVIQDVLAGASSKILDQNYEEDGEDDWLEEENSEISGVTIPLGNEEDVSFSDLEDDDDGNVRTNSKKIASGSDTSTKDSQDWVQLSRSSADAAKDGHSVSTGHREPEQLDVNNPETKETNDWLSIDDIDVV
ncbi:hypothetical protein HHK36_008264 [Tetracentron sinense]|uniref:BSD domain-containing protein n=1 Tax=Tetracentron sinense TaxID=13715 RepID=A0A834ZF58_TETSI|nr:hypothetical protein HHK36_008264 [Tetracentron sinense]